MAGGWLDVEGRGFFCHVLLYIAIGNDLNDLKPIVKYKMRVMNRENKEKGVSIY